MKKNDLADTLYRKKSIVKLILTMKLTFLFAVLNIVLASAAIYPQDARLTLKLKDATLKEAISQIEGQTSYSFIYKADALNFNEKINVEASNKSIEEILNNLFADNKVQYKILDNSLIVLLPATGALQQVKITGKVTDAGTGESLPGVNVIVEGTTVGTTSDGKGQFTINVPDANSNLIFSYVGYTSQTVAVNGREVVDVILSADIKNLDEVVVIGYGVAKKGDLSGASTTVTEDKLKGSVVANLDQALQGRAAGVTAVYTSGQPGTGVSISIRGQGTLRASASEPLYVIDGVPVQNVSKSALDIGLAGLGNGSIATFSGLANINPSDILTMEILKDASATAIYGSQGANGVVLITTKRGKTGEAKFSYEGYYALQQPYTRLKLMNLREFAQYSTDWANETKGKDPRVEFADPSILGNGTDWQDALFRTAPMQSHQISAQGGTDKVKYYVSGGYYNQDGIVVGTDFKRYSARVNLDANLKKWFKLGTNIMFSNTRDHLQLNNSQEGIISVALATTPDVPVRNADGTWAGIYYEGAPSIINPIAKAMDETNILKRTNLNGNIFTDITFLKGLTLRTELGTDLGYSNTYGFIPTYQYGSLVNATNSITRQYNQNKFWQLKNYLTYTTLLGHHSISAMFGQEVSESRWEYMKGSGSGLTSNDIQEPGLATANTMAIGSGDGSSAMSSFFARASYSFNAKYYLTYTFRYDGSSNFGPENRWAPFNAFAVSWKVINEPFMESLKGTINNFKIRAGWGQTGNQNIGGYRWGASITKMPTGLGQGFRQSNLANPYISWEKQVQTNLGFDFGFFKDRIILVADLYKKISTAMLMDMQLPSYMGTSGNGSIRLNPPMGNFGKIQNQGLEISLTTRPIVGKFSYENDIQLTFNKNKLLGLNGTPAAHIEGYGQWTDLVSLTEIGDPLNNFYGYKVAGVYQDKADIENSAKTKAYPADGNFKRSTVWPGDLKFKDISGPNGVPDGVIDEFDRTNLGSPQPKFTYGFNNIFRYQDIELSVFINGSYGNKIMNYLGRSLSNMTSPWSNQLQTSVNRAKLEPIDPNVSYPYVNASGTSINNWFDDIDNVRVQNSGTNIPRAVAGDPNENSRISDRYIEDGSYLRFKNITLAYYIPKNIIKKVGVENLKVYINIQNMWTITKYTGLDPEVGASQTSDNVFGLDNGRYPSARTYTFGLNFTF
jgi:TonB-linked SusC/RagA family outer membrane protein